MTVIPLNPYRIAGLYVQFGVLRQIDVRSRLTYGDIPIDTLLNQQLNGVSGHHLINADPHGARYARSTGLDEEILGQDRLHAHQRALNRLYPVLSHS